MVSDNSILSLNQPSFMAALDELGISGQQRDFLIREKRKHDSLLGGIMDFGAVPPGQKRATILPMISPEGMSGFDAITSGQAQFALPSFITGAVEGAARAVDLPRASLAMQIPPADSLAEAINMAGMVQLGGAATSGAGLLDYDPNVVSAGFGPKINKETLDPLGYQNTKMRDYLTNTQLDIVDLGLNLPRIPVKWEDMLGKAVMPFYGDRTSGGQELRGIDGTKFSTPVFTEAGLDFMRGPASQADRAIWASNSNIISRLANEADKARENLGVEDIYGMTGTMAPDANDFATFTGATMAEMVPNAPIKAKDAKAFDDFMASIDPDFVGVNSPLLRTWVETTSPEKRKSFIRLMDSAPMQAAGFPSPAQVRYAVTDVTQRDMPAGMFGMGVAKIDPVSPILRNTPQGNNPAASVPHSTYNTQLTGDYVGSLPPVPQGLLFRDVYDRMEGKLTKSGQPLTQAHKTQAIKTIVPVQPITEPILEGILGYLSRLER
jgi:hypothetical protein